MILYPPAVQLSSSEFDAMDTASQLAFFEACLREGQEENANQVEEWLFDKGVDCRRLAQARNKPRVRTIVAEETLPRFFAISLSQLAGSLFPPPSLN